MKHYFILSFDAETNTWDWDTDQEEVAFPDGTVYNEETNEWTIAYLGDGEYIDNEDEVSSQMYRHIRLMNQEPVQG
jgi:hypothetical protein